MRSPLAQLQFDPSPTVGVGAFATGTPLDDWHPIPLHHTTQIIGDRQSGKSTLLRVCMNAALEDGSGIRRLFQMGAHRPQWLSAQGGPLRNDYAKDLMSYFGTDLGVVPEMLRRWKPEAWDLVVIDDATDFVYVPNSTDGEIPIAATAGLWLKILQYLQQTQCTVLLAGTPKKTLSGNSAIAGRSAGFIASVTVLLDCIATTEYGPIIEMYLRKSRWGDPTTTSPLRVWVSPDQTPPIVTT